jgi:hypothetical protein
MLNKLIQEVVNQYGCQEQEINVGPLFEHSVFLEMGPNCESCTNSIQCKNELIDKITQTFDWITQIKVY